MTEEPVNFATPAPKPKSGKVSLLGTFAYSDLGNAERLVARHRDRVRWCPPRKSWLTWEGRRWAWDETDEVTRLAKGTVRGILDEASRCGNDEARAALAKHAIRSEAGARIKMMVELAKSEAGIPVLPAQLDADPWLLNVQNGTIDLRTGKLREHRRGDLITKIAPVDFDPEADHELWWRCIEDATGGDDELAGYLARIAGYSLVGAAPEKAFFFFWGPPNTAKSTVLGAWENALGDYAMSADFETWCQRREAGGNRGDLVRLMGSRLVTSIEVGSGRKLDEALMKRVTGGDAITAAAKFEDDLSFTCTWTLVLAANDAPRIRDNDDGMWSRVQRVPFEHVIAEPDPKFREQLNEPDVAAAVLAWAVAGCLEWQERGLDPPASVKASTAAYRDESDRFKGFADEALVIDPDGSITRKQARKLYVTWAEDEGVKYLLDAKDFASRLRGLGAKDGKSNGQRVWKGVREADMYDRGQGHGDT